MTCIYTTDRSVACLTCSYLGRSFIYSSGPVLSYLITYAMLSCFSIHLLLAQLLYPRSILRQNSLVYAVCSVIRLFSSRRPVWLVFLFELLDFRYQIRYPEWLGDHLYLSISMDIKTSAQELTSSMPASIAVLICASLAWFLLSVCLGRICNREAYICSNSDNRHMCTDRAFCFQLADAFRTCQTIL